MAGIGDNVAIIGDWVPPPSPSTRAFFSSILGENSGFQEVSEPSNGSETEELLGHCQQMVSGNANDKNVSEACNSRNQVAVLCSISELKSNSCNGLVERIAARVGFNAPRLNTESIKSPELSLNSDVRSPYLTIPPGLNPTTLLDSPVFVSSSLVYCTFPPVQKLISSDIRDLAQNYVRVFIELIHLQRLENFHFS